MHRSLSTCLLTTCLVAACATVPPERQLLADVADALGGQGRLVALKTLRIEGGGVASFLGQNTLPESEPPTWKVTDYVRTIDLGAWRVSTKQERTVQFAFAGPLVSRPNAALDGDVAFNVGADGVAARAGERDARDRRIELLHHPVTILRAALDSGSMVGAVRTEGEDDVVDVTTAKGDVLTLSVNRASKLPSRVRSRAANPNLGDMVLSTAFLSYQDTGGVKLPARIEQRLDSTPVLMLDVARYVLDEPADLAASAAVKAAAPPVPAPEQVAVESAGKGIWWLAGSGNHRSVVFEFADHLLLYEVPVNEARSKAVIDTARALSPKPLTHVVVSHHHFDHSGGLRVAVAEGLTVVTHRLNEAFFKMLVSRPHTLEPDALARAPKPLTLQLVDDTLTLKDASMEVQLFHLLENEREGTNLYAYVPRDRMLVQADLYDATWLRHLWGENVLINLAQRKLRVDQMVPVHGPRQSFAEMVRTIKSKPS